MRKHSRIPELSRREALLLAAGATIVMAGGVVLGPKSAAADQAMLDAAIKKAIGDKKPAAGKITLDLPQIAENGNTVPLTVTVDSPMTDASHVKAVHIFADGNPAPDVASFMFTAASGKAKASTRIRLAKTQHIVAVAEMSDGSAYTAKKECKVTIGGCGG